MGSFVERVKYYREVCSPEKCFFGESTIKQFQSDVNSVNSEKRSA